MSGPTVIRPAVAASIYPAARASGLAAMAALCLGLAHSAEDGPGLLTLLADEDAPADLRSAAAVAAGLTRVRGEAERFAKVVRGIEDPMLRAWGL